jgi:hypothetical protein
MLSLRTRRVFLAAAWLLPAVIVALAPAGCRSWPAKPADEKPGALALKPLPADPASRETPMYQVRVVRLQHRVRPDAPVEDIWRLLGTTNLSYARQALWEANDLRVGEGAQLAAERLNALTAETADRTASVSVLVVRENMDFVITAGGERDAIELMWTDAQGRLSGRRFEKAVAQFRCVCRRGPDGGAAVHLAIEPEIQYGAEELRWVRTPTGMVQRMSRAAFPLADLAAEVRLDTGRLLVLGGRRGSNLSLGGAMFAERRGPDTWVQTLVISAAQAVPGAPPPDGGPAPFIPRPKTRPGTAG